MPKVFEYNGFKFFFFSNEGDPSEPVHVHVRKGGCQAKIWVAPRIELAENHGFGAGELRMILQQTNEHADLILEVWDAHFN